MSKTISDLEIIESNLRINEFPINLNLSVEVWFGYRHDISIAVLTDGVNDVVTRHFTWDDLYAEIGSCDHLEPTPELLRSAKLQTKNRQKQILKRMIAFANEKGIK